MAESNVLENNGHITDIRRTGPKDVKILVMGEPGCGKSSFIQRFYELNESEEPYEEPGRYSDEWARVYPCAIEIVGGIKTEVKVFEILGAPVENVNRFAKTHTDANGFIIMFAIDDPVSFQQVDARWRPIIGDNAAWSHGEPAIVVGNKRDLRENQQVIQRLLQDNQAPITQEEGETLVRGQIRDYFDCSSIPPHTHNVEQAFDRILNLALADFNADLHGYAVGD